MFGPLFRFNRDYYKFDESGKPEGYQNLGRMREKLEPIVLRRRKADVETELPERTDETRFVELTQGQRAEHDELGMQVKQLLARARTRALRKEEHEFLMILLGKMRMLCDTQYILDKETKVSPKLDELVEIFDTALADPDTKVIVFSEWVKMLELIREHLEKRKIGFAWHTGSVPQKKRRVEIKAFKEDPDCRVFLCTESGGAGLNLQNASVVINVDIPWNPAKLEQRIARAWRKGQQRPVTVINLVARNTIEHGMLETLALKQGLSDGVLDGIGELGEVKLKRGGQSFLTRLQQTLMVGENTVVRKSVGRKKASSDPSADFARTLLAELKTDLVSCEEQFTGDTEAPAKLVIVLEKDAAATRESIVRHLRESVPHLAGLSPELIDDRLVVIDRATADALANMQRLGLINTNIRARRNLLGVTESVQDHQLDEDTLKRISELETELARKLKIADLLLPADLWQEAVPALTSALLITCEIAAIKCNSPFPRSEAELCNPEFRHLLEDPDLTGRFLDDADSGLALDIATLLKRRGGV